MSFSLKNYSEVNDLSDNGMSRSFRAIERSTNHTVVIKKFALDPAHRSSSLERLENTVRNSSSLIHNNIISILDYGSNGDDFYIVMEHIDGCDLNWLISDDSFNRKVGIMIVYKVLQALSILHKKGIFHCNIKPSNVLIGKTGRVVLTDFGLSHTKTHAQAFQNRQDDFSSLLFMPPEQAKLDAKQAGIERDVWKETTSLNTGISAKRARALTEKCIQWDLWSIGVLMYRICTGYYPFYSDDIVNLFICIKYLDPIKINKLVNGLPEPIADVIEQCLKKKPSERLRSLDQLIDTLEQYFSSMGISHIDETIAAYIREKMGVPSIAGEIDIFPDDITATDLLSMESESGEDLTGCKEIKPVSPRQPEGQNNTELLNTPIKNSGALRLKTRKLSRNKVRSLSSLFFNPFLRIILPLVALTTIIIMIIVGTQIFNTHFGEALHFTKHRLFSIAHKCTYLTNQGMQSINQIITPHQDSADSSQKTKVTALPEIRTKIDSALENVNQEEHAKTGRSVLNSAQVPATKNPVVTKSETVSGVLKVSVNTPEAQVSIDGYLIAQDEMANGKRIALGKHKIVAEATGYVTYDQSFRIESNKTTILALVLKPDVKGNGQIHIYSYPWANLYIDDVLIGTTPTPSPILLAEGNHRVVLMRDGYQNYNEVVNIVNGNVTRLQVQLKKTGEE